MRLLFIQLGHLGISRLRMLGKVFFKFAFIGSLVSTAATATADESQ